MYIIINKAWFKTIANESKGQISLGSSSPGFENFNYNNALLNYNNGLKA